MSAMNSGRTTAGVVAFLLSLVVACDAPTPPEPAPRVASVRVLPQQLDLTVGETMQLEAQALAADGSVLSRPMEWRSESDAVGVTANGVLEARAPGVAIVIASSEGVDGRATVNVAAPLPPPPPPPPPADFAYELIYSVRSVDIFQETYRKELALAAAPVRLFAAGQWASQAKASPDGSRILYVAPNPIIGDPSIWVANRDGSASAMIAAFIGEAFGEPVWSSDGQRIAFTRTKNESGVDVSHIWVARADGSDAIALTASVAGSQSMPSWSPTLADGTQRIAYVQDINGSARIWTMRIDGSDRVQLTTGAAFDIQPAWSPDGRMLVFQRSSPTVDRDLWLMQPDGSNPRPVFAGLLNGGQMSPAWSPDGRLIAFTSNHEGTYEVYTVGADGSALARRTSGNADTFSPSWLPKAQ